MTYTEEQLAAMDADERRFCVLYDTTERVEESALELRNALEDNEMPEQADLVLDAHIRSITSQAETLIENMQRMVSRLKGAA